jgi:hypothetical protein
MEIIVLDLEEQNVPHGEYQDVNWEDVGKKIIADPLHYILRFEKEEGFKIFEYLKKLMLSKPEEWASMKIDDDMWAPAVILASTRAFQEMKGYRTAFELRNGNFYGFFVDKDNPDIRIIAVQKSIAENAEFHARMN